MTKLEELIKDFCPNGVEYKKINEIAVQLNGMSGVSGKWADEGNCEFIDYMNVYKNIKIDTELIKKATVKSQKQTTLEQGDILFTSASEVPNECAISSVIEKPIKRGVFLDDHLFGIRIKSDFKSEIDSVFLNYYFRSDSFRCEINKVVRGVTRFYISKTDFMSLQIPLPALPVQREIVRVLDSFTLYSAELTAELTARCKQYEFYRDKLLDFNTSIEETTIGDIALVTKLAGFEFTNYVKYSDFGNVIALRGLNVKNGKLDLTDIKYIDGSDFSKLNRSKLQIGDMLFTYVGTIGQVALIEEDDKYYLAPNVALIRLKRKDIMPKYIRYYFQSNAFFSTQILRLLQSSSMQNIPMEKIRKFVVKIPPIEVQERIVKVLDNFDAICSDLGIGLPAEIEKRQKQYEYYRDKLLSF